MFLPGKSDRGLIIYSNFDWIVVKGIYSVRKINDCFKIIEENNVFKESIFLIPCIF